MVGTSKILTVSYGTFSCTLEGFDDSFDTMKAIAEYFRDLAADDRYFGAEPPQPDADMLARIAEREIARRVEAHTDNGAVHLRAAALAAPAASASAAEADLSAGAAQAEKSESTDAPVVAPAEAPAETALPAQTATAATDAAADDTITDAQALADANAQSSIAALLADQAEQSDHADPVTQAAETELSDHAAPAAPVADAPAAASVEDPGEDDSVAAKLRRIRAVVGQGATTAVAAQFTEDEHADDFMGETARDIDDILRTDTDTDEDTGDAAVAVDALSAFEPAEPATPATDIWDETPAATDDARPDPVADIDTEAGDDWPDMTGDRIGDEADPDDDLPSASSTDIDAPADAEAETDAETDADAEPVADAAASEAAPRVRVLRMKRAEFEAAVASGQIEEDTDDALPATSLSDEDEADLQRELAAVEAELAGDLAIDDDDATTAMAAPDEAIHDDDEIDSDTPFTEEDYRSLGHVPETDDESDAALAELAASRARFATHEGDDFDDAEEDEQPRADTSAQYSGDATGEDEAEHEDEDADDDHWEAAESAEQYNDRLTPVDEDALDRNLAAIMADGDDFETDEDEDADGQSSGLAASIRQMARRTVKMGSEARERLTARAPEDDAEDVDRLMDQAKGKLDEPHGQTRRNAIQHLRAAVAATKAEKEAAPASDQDEDEIEAYRGDLAEAVRPRRPSPATATERPARPRVSERPAPLKLVAEQRVDLPRDEPVRPRRVGQELAASLAEADGFADFAEQVGAHTLPELLEAAAAYMSFVEGRDEFSRPQLMTAVRAVSENAFSREDGLRYFGQLLRDGKIEKIDGGRFAASDANGYAPEDRAAG